MSNPRQSAWIAPTKAALSADRGSAVARYAVPLDDPRLFRWIPGDTTTTDGVDVLGYSGGTAGTWQVATNGGASQSVWYINSSTGDDANSGLTSTTALETVAEYLRRVGSSWITTSQTVYLSGTFDEDISAVLFLRGATTVTWRGTRVAGTTGTITSATNIVTTNGSETYCEITASGLTSTWTAAGAVGAMVVTSSGAVCFGVKDLGSKRLRITPPYNPTTYSNVTISNGDTFTVYTLTQVGGSVAIGCLCDGNNSGLNLVDLSVGEISDPLTNPHATEFNAGFIYPTTCILRGLDIYGSAYVYAYDCLTVDGLRRFQGSDVTFDHGGAMVTTSGSPPASHAGGQLTLDSFVIQGSALVCHAQALINTSTFVACFDSPSASLGNGVEVLAGGHVRIKGKLFGTCNSVGSGVWVDVAGLATYESSKPIAITGGAQDTTIGGTTKSYTTLSTTGFLNTTNGAAIVGTAYTRG